MGQHPIAYLKIVMTANGDPDETWDKIAEDHNIGSDDPEENVQSGVFKTPGGTWQTYNVDYFSQYDDYHDGFPQVEAKKGEMVLTDVVLNDYGDSKTFADFEAKRQVIEKFAADLAAKYDLTVLPTEIGVAFG